MLTALILFACAAAPVRLPASVKKNYNPERVAKLKKAAENGILFVINDHVFRDIEKTEVDLKCRTAEPPEWSDKLFSYLGVFDSKPNLYRKFHVIEIRRGDTPGFKLQKDLDGLSYLSIQYSRSENTEKIDASIQLPCDALESEYRNKHLTRVTIQWPAVHELTNFLMNEADRPAVERFNFDTRFINFLAERSTILKFTQELGFDKTADGKYVLVEVLSQLSQQLMKLQQENSLKNIEHWMSEISQKSIQGSGLQLFQISRDIELSHGIRVDTEGEFSRRMQGHFDPTYLFMGYKTESGSVVLPSLVEMDHCLSNLTSMMSVGFSNRKPASDDRNSFLRPGYSCRHNQTAQ